MDYLANQCIGSSVKLTRSGNSFLPKFWSGSGSNKISRDSQTFLGWFKGRIRILGTKSYRILRVWILPWSCWPDHLLSVVQPDTVSTAWHTAGSRVLRGYIYLLHPSYTSYWSYSSFSNYLWNIRKKVNCLLVRLMFAEVFIFLVHTPPILDLNVSRRVIDVAPSSIYPFPVLNYTYSCCSSSQRSLPVFIFPIELTFA